MAAGTPIYYKILIMLILFFILLDSHFLYSKSKSEDVVFQFVIRKLFFYKFVESFHQIRNRKFLVFMAYFYLSNYSILEFLSTKHP